MKTWMRVSLGWFLMLSVILGIGFLVGLLQMHEDRKKAARHFELTFADGRIFQASYYKAGTTGAFGGGPFSVYVKTCDGRKLHINGIDVEIQEIKEPCP